MKQQPCNRSDINVIPQSRSLWKTYMVLSNNLTHVNCHLQTTLMPLRNFCGQSWVTDLKRRKLYAESTVTQVLQTKFIIENI